MHLPMIVLSLLAIADQWLLALSEGSFLASTRFKLATTVASREHLRAEAAELAGVLRSLLGIGAKVTPQHVALAREQLGEEANRLDLEGVPGAELMREYALRAPSVVLLLPAPEPVAFEVPGVLSAMPLDVEAVEGVQPVRQLASESEETILSKDAEGHIVTRMKHCKNGNCMERTEMNSAAPISSERSTQGRVSAANLSKSAAFADVVRRMANEMWGVEQSLGHSRLQGVFQEIFADRDMQPAGDVLRDLDHGQLANASALSDEMQQMQSVSSSIETIVKDGTMLRRERHCRNGQCVTKAFRGETSERKPAADDDTAKDGFTAYRKDKTVDMPL